MKSRQFVLTRRPEGIPSRQHINLVEADLPRILRPGEVLLETLYLSLDPYMYGRMAGNQSHAAPAQLGAPIPGESICRVLKSNAPGFAPGDLVRSHSGWQTHSIADAKTLRSLPAEDIPLTASLGILGMPGFTAYQWAQDDRPAHTG